MATSPQDVDEDLVLKMGRPIFFHKVTYKCGEVVQFCGPKHPHV